MTVRVAPLGWAVVGLLALAAPLVAIEREEFLLMTALVLAVFATSFNIVLGYTGLVTFAHAAYYGVGAYTVALLWAHLGWPVLAGAVVAPVAAAAAALVTGLVALRAVRLYFALLTLGLGQLVFLLAFQWRSVTRGDDGISGIDLPAILLPTTNRYLFLVGMAAVALAAMARIVRSPFGATLRAIRENPQRAGFLGVNVKRYQLASFTLGGFFAGYAGAMYAIFDRQAFPLLLHWTTSAEPIVVTLIGGLTSFAGPTVGAFVFVFLRDVITRGFSYWQAVLGVVLLLIILFMPGGLVEGVKRIAALVGRRRPSRPAPRGATEPAEVDAEQPVAALKGDR
ncbi:MAG: branched-chain amino acid ABC transporter permease [Acidimicrobiales bacterium]